MSMDNAVEGVLKRDRHVVLGALALVVALSWLYILSGAGMEMSAIEMTRMSLGQGETGDGNMAGSGSDNPAMEDKVGQPAMAAMSGMAMMAPAIWDFGYAVLMFFMWWIMMIAMMLPAAAPMILLFATVNRRHRERGNPFVPTTIFAASYLLIWAGFSIVAVALQWGFESLALLSPTLVSASVIFGGVLLVAAGIYQMTPLKQACLRHCRSPIQFLTMRWRNGPQGAFKMGIEHGAYCVGCCWFLMGLLFFGGVMNLYWIAGLAVFVLLEKTVPAGHWLGYGIGTALMGWGGWVLYSGL